MKLSIMDIELLTVINKLDRKVDPRAYAALLRADNVECSYSEILKSYNALLDSGLTKKIYSKFFGGSLIITSKGRAVIAYAQGKHCKKAIQGKRIAEEEFDSQSEKIPFKEEEWNWANLGLQEESCNFASPVKQAKKYAASKWKALLAVTLWLLSLACLATGITFACFSWVTTGWRVGAPILGVVLYTAIGCISCGLITSRVKYAVEKFISIVCLPALGLLVLIVVFIGYA